MEFHFGIYQTQHLIFQTSLHEYRKTFCLICTNLNSSVDKGGRTVTLYDLQTEQQTVRQNFFNTPRNGSLTILKREN